MNNAKLSTLDLKHFWHPCSQMKDHENLPIIPIKFGRGALLYDYDGNSYIDCISSWWVNLFGHANPYINSALSAQVNALEHTIMAGFSHEPIINLSARLAKISGFDKCFYADNGSSAIEVAMKMSYHKNLLLGHKKCKFLSLKNSYHGETIGALSVGDVDLYKKTYDGLVLQTIQTEVPVNFYNQEVDEQTALACLEERLNQHEGEISAFIIEPLVQCAGNMNMYSPNFVKQACDMVKERGIDTIFDEIAVGFGRTGSMFAYEQCGVMPDFLCLSKGISGGYLPLSVVLVKDEIYDVFYAPYAEFKAFLHSHSYTGNALACACANATLDIFENENIVAKNALLSSYIFKEFSVLKEFEFVKNFRQTGMILAFDLHGFDGQRKGYEIYLKALKKGLLLRPLANTIYFMPPYIITKEQISYVVGVLKELLGEI